jgi:hypothetical protein
VLQKSVDPAHPQGYLGRIIVMGRQRYERRLFLFHKQFQRRSAGSIMDVKIRTIGQPPSAGLSEILQVFKSSAV